MYLYIHKVKAKGRIYEYLVIEEYLGGGERRVLLRVRKEDAIRILLEHGKDQSTPKEWCGGWDLNPRRPTPTGLKPAPFGQARAPPHPIYCLYLGVDKFYRVLQGTLINSPSHWFLLLISSSDLTVY